MEWAKGKTVGEDENEDEDVDDGEDKANTKKNQQSDYLLLLMYQADIEEFEMGSKFTWLMNLLLETNRTKLLIFSSWYVCKLDHDFCIFL
jgi:hypothetical protein